MTPTANHDAALRDYLDALLESSPTPTQRDDGSTRWQLCTLGRLHLLLPAAALGPTVDRADLSNAPTDWHLASVRIGAGARRVIELVRIIVPQMAVAPVDSLLPITGTEWMLAVPGWPQHLTLTADAIQWRLRRNSRKWLAGMSSDTRYMALDVHELIAQASADAAVEDPSS